MDRSSAVWYGIGALIIIAGMVGALLGALRGMSGLDEKFIRFAMPGEADIFLNVPGPYVIYYERRGVVNGEIFQTAELTDIKCSVTARDGTAVPINPTALNTSAFESPQDSAIAEFSVPKIGTYAIACAYPNGKGSRVALAVAPSLGGEAVAMLLKWVALALGSLGLGLVILIVTLVRRADRAPRMP